MESGSPSASSSDLPPQRGFANAVGTAIALLTLLLPLLAIAHYSPNTLESLPQTTSYPLRGLRN